MTIINDDSSVVNKLEASLTDDDSHHLQSSHVYSTSHTGPPFLLTKPENVNKMDQWLVL